MINEKTKKDLVSVFIPTTPNPTSGVLMLVPRKDIIMLDMTIEDASKVIISGGLITPGMVVENGTSKEVKKEETDSSVNLSHSE